MNSAVDPSRLEHGAPLPLPRYVTGFRHVKDATPMPRVEAKRFRAACWAVAHELGGKVAAFEDGLSMMAVNYHCADLELLHGPLRVLCNTQHPLLAFVRPAPARWSWGDTAWTWDAAAAEAFSQQPGFVALDTSFLEAAVTAEALAGLHPVERKMVASCRPETLGELVFNTWD